MVISLTNIIKEEFKMSDYNINMDGKEHKFGEATRYTKDGKGRFDLLHADVASAIIANIVNVNHDASKFKDDEYLNIYEYAMYGCYVSAIVHLMMKKYGDNGKVSLDVAFVKMLKELAVHFQKGAEKYGERNCEKGIPEWSFKDSGIRHMTQYFNGETDENHFIAAIWNFWMAEWTMINHPERCIGYKKKHEDKKCDGNCKCDGKCKSSDEGDIKMRKHYRMKKINPDKVNDTANEEFGDKSLDDEKSKYYYMSFEDFINDIFTNIDDPENYLHRFFNPLSDNEHRK